MLEEKEAVLPRDLRQGHAGDLSEQPLRGASSLSLQPAGSPWALSPTAQGFEEASMCRNPKFRWLPLLEGDRCATPNPEMALGNQARESRVQPHPAGTMLKSLNHQCPLVSGGLPHMGVGERKEDPSDSLCSSPSPHMFPALVGRERRPPRNPERAEPRGSPEERLCWQKVIPSVPTEL